MSLVPASSAPPPQQHQLHDPQQQNGDFVQLEGLIFNLAESMEQCLGALQKSGLVPFPNPTSGERWCNATWDSVLCWPATPASSSVTLQCPPMKGLDPTRNITKHCHSSGRWMGKNENDFDPGRPHGWTNFTMCFTEEVNKMMQQLDNGTLSAVQGIAKNARKLEFVGLGLSFVTLAFCVIIFSYFRRLRVFRNLLHLHLMVAILFVVLIRLVLYIDLIFTEMLGPILSTSEQQGKTINTMMIVCETMFFSLEYFKSVAFWWMFLEGMYLHNQLVFSVFNTDPKLWPYLLAGYGIPLLHTFIWLLIIVIKKQGKVERCLGSYYLEHEFWVLNGPRMLQLVLNTLFIGNVIRVLWLKVRDSHCATEIDRMNLALMLIPLLGIPNLMQIPNITPTKENIFYFAVWTYCASFTYMYQGFIISIIYCFTNREVVSVIKRAIYKYRLNHLTPSDLRRSAHSQYSQIRNGSCSVGGVTHRGDAATTLDQQSTCSPVSSNGKQHTLLRLKLLGYTIGGTSHRECQCMPLFDNEQLSPPKILPPINGNLLLLNGASTNAKLFSAVAPEALTRTTLIEEKSKGKGSETNSMDPDERPGSRPTAFIVTFNDDNPLMIGGQQKNLYRGAPRRHQSCS